MALWNNLFQSVALLALFMLYALAFAISEFTCQWRGNPRNSGAA